MPEDENTEKKSYLSRIELENFMCHRKFVQDLSPGLNILIGKNGSGKSSVLTSIMVGLGGRASSTARGESLADFIKTGAQAAFITLTFHVSEDNLHFLERYGPQVTIERRLKPKESQFTIKNHAGKIVGRSVQDVKELCFHFGIFPENQIAMLSQENAKEFLVNASPQLKYARLRAALHQQQLAQHEREIMNIVTAQKLESQSADIKERQLEKTIAQAKRVLSLAEESETWDNDILILKALQSWSAVCEKDNLVAKGRNDLQEAEYALRRLEDVESFQREEAELSLAQARCQGDLEQITEKISNADGQVLESERQVDRMKHRIRRQEEEAKIAEQEYINASQEYQQTRQRQQDADPEVRRLKRTELESQLAKMETRLTEVERELVVAATERDEASNRSSEQSDRVRPLQNQKDSIDSEIRRLEEELQSAHNGNMDRLQGYSKEVRQLVMEIANHEWERDPLGPLGRFVTISDQFVDYSPLFERLFNRLVTSFWVTTRKDEALLRKLAFRCKIPDLQIIKRDDDPYDFQSSLPPTSNEYARFVDVLEFKDPAVQRLWVDQLRIEHNVIAYSVHGAMEATDPSHKHPNVRFAFTRQEKGTNFLRAGSQIRDAQETIPIYGLRLAPRMNMTLENRVKELKKSLEDGQRRKLDIEKYINEIHREQFIINKSKASASRRLRDLGEERQTLQRNIDNVREEIVEHDSHRNEDFNDEIRRTQDRLRRAEISRPDKDYLAESQEELLNRQRAFDHWVNEVKRLKAEEQQLLRVQNDLNRKSSHMDVIRANRRDEIRIAFEATENLQERLQQLIEARDDTEEDFAKLGVKSPIEDPEAYSRFSSKSDLERTELLTQLESQKEKFNLAEDAVSVAESERRTAEIELNTLRANTDRARKILDKITDGSTQRHEQQRRMWESSKSKVRRNFATMLAQRGFIGELLIEDRPNEKGKVESFVKPDRANGDIRDTSSLSGGEKSFTQIALLMAVWEVMQAGLVAMDEYDVFMDKANRSKSLNLLATSIQKHQMQCILITPQDVDISALPSDIVSTVKLHRLKPARQE